MVSSVSGLSMADYQAYLQQQGVQIGENGTISSITYENDSVQLSSSKEKCTDGKDDGKIGLLSAVGNTIKGVGKTIVNGVKGMFTNSEGEFSLGKTLLSVGTAATCIAFPALGVAACAIGGVMGAIQVGKGVYNAATADTDAQAKEAWQNIGGGAFTVAASVTGAKAGVKAVKNTSTAKGGLASLDDNAKLGQKAVALGKDMVSSTKNQYNTVKTSATAYAKTAQEGVKGYKQKQNINKAKAEMNTAETSTEYNTAKANFEQAKSEYNVSVDTKQKIAKFETTKNNIVDSAKHPQQTAKNALQTAKEVREINKTRKANAKALAKQEAGKTLTETETQAISNWDNLSTKGYSEEALQIVQKQNEIGFNLSESAKSLKNLDLKGTQAQIAEALTSGETTYAQAVQKYGYDNVAQVLQYLGGKLFATENE